MTKRVITLGVPCEINSTRVVEDFIDVIAPQLHMANEENTVRELKNVLNEAFTNIVRHSGHTTDLPIEVYFELDRKKLTIKMRYSGAGFPVNDIPPPYPETLIGSQHLLRVTINGELSARIIDPGSVRILFDRKSEEQSRDKLISSSQPGGMGLCIMAQLSDNVCFSQLDKGENELKIIKLLN